MRTLIFVLIGMTLGACLSLMMAAAAIFVLPMIMADAEQLPDIVGTLLVAQRRYWGWQVQQSVSKGARMN